MHKLSRKVTLEAVRIVGFGKKGNAVTDGGTKKEPLVLPIDQEFINANSPQVGDFFGRVPTKKDEPDEPWVFMSLRQLQEEGFDGLPKTDAPEETAGEEA